MASQLAPLFGLAYLSISEQLLAVAGAITVCVN